MLVVGKSLNRRVWNQALWSEMLHPVPVRCALKYFGALHRALAWLALVGAAWSRAKLR